MEFEDFILGWYGLVVGGITLVVLLIDFIIYLFKDKEADVDEFYRKIMGVIAIPVVVFFLAGMATIFALVIGPFVGLYQFHKWRTKRKTS